MARSGSCFAAGQSTALPRRCFVAPTSNRQVPDQRGGHELVTPCSTRVGVRARSGEIVQDMSRNELSVVACATLPPDGGIRQAFRQPKVERCAGEVAPKSRSRCRPSHATAAITDGFDVSAGSAPQRSASVALPHLAHPESLQCLLIDLDPQTGRRRQHHGAINNCAGTAKVDGRQLLAEWVRVGRRCTEVQAGGNTDRTGEADMGREGDVECIS